MSSENQVAYGQIFVCVSLPPLYFCMFEIDCLAFNAKQIKKSLQIREIYGKKSFQWNINIQILEKQGSRFDAFFKKNGR